MVIFGFGLLVLFTGTPVAVSTGSEDDISKAGTLEANLYARSIPIAADVVEADDILYYDIIQKAHLKINT
jgi:hypothetical protein